MPVGSPDVAADGRPVAQTSVKLVGNIASTTQGLGDRARLDHAQAFTTGDGGYRLTKVVLSTYEVQGVEQSYYSLKIHNANTDGTAPGTAVGTLTQPSSLPSSWANVDFTAPAGGIWLSPNTTYFVVWDSTGTGFDGDLNITSLDGEDDDSAAGWSIADGRLQRIYNAGSWGGATSSLRMEIHGYLDLSGDNQFTGDDGGDDEIYGGFGNDTINGQGGNDILDGGPGDDTIHGGAGHDTIYGKSGDDTVTGGSGNDKIYGSFGDDDLRAGDGNDVIYGDERNDPDGGDDVIWAGNGYDFIDGGAGADEIYGDSSVHPVQRPPSPQWVTNYDDPTKNYYNTIGDWAYPGDTLSYYLSNAGVTLNLGDPAQQNSSIGSGGHAQGDTVNGIENIVGSRFNDRLTGDQGPNLFRGGEGADILDGDGHNDYDAADYRDSDCGVVVTIWRSSTEDTQGNGRNNPANCRGKTSTAQGDRLIDIANIHGSHHADVISGLDANNSISRLFGHKGDDTIHTGDGHHRIDGGPGNDTVSYSRKTSADQVFVNLDITGLDRTLPARNEANAVICSAGVTCTPASFEASGGRHKLFNIENVIGSAGNDRITGNNRFNILRGGPGNDTLTSIGGDNLYGDAGNDHFNAAAGYDQIDGGPGTDVVSYLGATAGVDVNLDTGRSGDSLYNTTFASGDTYTGIENVIGSSHNDTITGDRRNNVFTGHTGTDTFRFNAAFGNDTIKDYDTNNNEVIRLCMGSAATASVANWSGVDRGSDHVITVTLRNARAGTITLEGVTVGDATSPVSLTVERFFEGCEALAPRVTSLWISSEPQVISSETYFLNEVITVSVHFNQKVTVTGTPRISIRMGSDTTVFNPIPVNYNDGSGTNTLTFNHTVAEPNTSTEGVAVVANSLNLNGGTIKGLSIHGAATSPFDAELAHKELDHNSKHLVNSDPEAISDD